MVSSNLQETFVCPIDVFVLQIQDGIDPVRLTKGTEAILEPEAGEHGGVMLRRLPLQIHLGGPPTGHAVLKLYCLPVKRIRVFGGAVDVLTGDLQVAGLLQDVGVGDKVRRLLGTEVGRETDQRQNQARDLKHRPSIGHKETVPIKIDIGLIMFEFYNED